MDLFQAYEQFRTGYPTMSAGSLVIFGAGIGWLLAWLFFKQQMATLRDRNDHLKEALNASLPQHLAAKLLAGAPSLGRRAKMGLGIIAAGLVIAAVGLLVVLSQNKEPIASSSSAPKSAEAPTNGTATKVSRKAQLQKFYIAGATLLRALPKDMSDDDLKMYQSECDAWLNETVNWIGANMGDAAKARFLDTSGNLSFSYSAAINEKHNNIIGAIVGYRKNLQVLISEFDSWDSNA